jgi:glycosyltransferase involved in cell wall biosynthesis
MSKTLSILQVSSYDRGGGAEKVAYDLFNAYRQRGYNTCLAVGIKKSYEDEVWEIPNDAYRNFWSGIWRERQKLFTANERRKAARLSGWLANLGELGRWREWRRGIEDFNFPASSRLLEIAPLSPDIVHVHNLHGGYFDLRSLPALSSRVPTVVTLHDEWAFTGHCSYTLGCQRWKLGCGDCPSLDTYPAIRCDATAQNIQRKREIYSHSKLYIAAPSKWLLEKVNSSILCQGIIETRLIPNGVDFNLFCPSDKLEARQELHLNPESKVVLFVGNRTRSNQFKDYATIEEAVRYIAARSNGHQIIFLCVGEKASEEQIDSTVLRFIDYQDDPRKIAQYYQAADVFLHAAHADNFPLTVLESLACGTPVVATATGGIAEQIENGKTGFLVPNGDSDAMAERVLNILSNDDLQKNLCQHALQTARHRFDLKLQVETYLNWYQEILERNIAESELTGAGRNSKSRCASYT